MRIGNAANWRFALGLAVLVLGAGLVGSSPDVPSRDAAGTAAAGPKATPSTRPAAPSAAAPQFAGLATAHQRPSTGSASDRAQAVLAAEAAGLTAGRPASSVSIAAIDTTTGTRVGWGAGSGMTAASVFKLLLLEGALLQNQDHDQLPGDGEADALTAMIENSDNDAADRVYAAIGGHAGVTATLDRVGLPATVLGPDDQWGLSTTSAADQLTLLTDLVSAQSPLSSVSRTYALQLMANVEADQRWGVGVATDPGTTFANKNGWLDVDDDDGRWAVSSVGVIQVSGHQVLLAVLTQHDADLSDGTALVESLSRAAATALREAANAAEPGPTSVSEPHH